MLVSVGYTPKSKNVLQTILENHFADFEACYEEKYAKQYRNFKLEMIADKVHRFLECGDYTKGVAKITCENPECKHKYFLPFSCKSWFLCPSCHEKRLLLFSERMNQEILLLLPHRQFVFTIPKMLRPFFRFNQGLFAEISKLISTLISNFYNHVSGERLDSGIIISYQTYGDFLRFNPHWHCIVLEGGVNNEGKFCHLPIKDTAKLCELFRRKVIHLLFKKGLLDEPKANMLLSWKNSGFSVDNSVLILPHDENARENISQYITRHPASLKKIIYEKTKGRVLYHTQYNLYFKENLKLFEASDFIAELTQHIPPKHKHYVRYYGLYSSRGKGKTRAEGRLNHLLPQGFMKAKDPQAVSLIFTDDTPGKKTQRSVWARLIQKVFEVDPLSCPHCGYEMAIKSFIFDHAELERIVAWIGHTQKPPPIKKLLKIG